MRDVAIVSAIIVPYSCGLNLITKSFKTAKKKFWFPIE